MSHSLISRPARMLAALTAIAAVPTIGLAFAAPAHAASAVGPTRIAALPSSTTVHAAPAFGLYPKPSNALNSPPCPPVMRQGENDGCVITVQNMVNWIVNYGLRVDGAYGPATANGVRALQGFCGVPKDGAVGPDTRNCMNFYWYYYS